MTIHCNYIGGEWREGQGTIANINPSDTNDRIGEYAEASPAQLDEAVAAARQAFPAWSRSGIQSRSELLDRIGQMILDRRAQLGELLAREEGKTLPEATGEVVRAGQIFRFFSGEILQLRGELQPSVRPGLEVSVTREALGVIGLITPWNFPIAIPAWKIAPALAYGNCVVFKPAELVPGSAHALAQIIAEAGVPDGVFNLVMGPGRVIGDALVNHPQVDAISFTGSQNTGRRIAAVAAARLAKVQLEMGGKNPLVVLDDADLDTAVECAVNGAFFSTGQRCTASSRLIVTSGIHDRFVEAVCERMKALVTDHALKAGTHIGPVVDERQLKQNLDYIDIGRGEGATLVCGGERVERETPGFYLTPALFTGTEPQMRINREEIFGPVATVIRADDYEQALALANDTEFGLSAGIVTRSLKHASHFKANAQAGMVMVNVPTAGVDYHVPFGGRKGSSYGAREQGSYAREFYTTVKTAYTLA
ncbi:aldehyde dehydrogenase family protein [Microbulbifer thermotolerans]|uniref:Aldehyde dehydrogenase family protein n=1 Tax=Microbulbifer thermotolerans TaxID=252514 RepID=A0AB35HYL0_MICTH|nr:aldehyde dehydrogenase family protein [Microbulbifer thermotolerans]MCX2802456.1 aldehyde dehydrogenase family protein [Microbulbifer thermotolerans]